MIFTRRRKERVYDLVKEGWETGERDPEVLKRLAIADNSNPRMNPVIAAILAAALRAFVEILIERYFSKQTNFAPNCPKEFLDSNTDELE